jgi:hypothetical protein
MFVSANFLAINYGVDDTIAKFFVDREPPANNLYWHEKLMYLRPEPGYLFIPLIVDLLYKLGISKAELLHEDFVSLMESVGHISALEETKQISSAEALERCTTLVSNNCKNETYYKTLLGYAVAETDNDIYTLRTPFKALHRGDAFLFSLCALTFSDEKIAQLVQYWFALISTLLLLDDAEDIDVDESNKDDNAFLEAGLNAHGINAIKQLVTHNLQLIDKLNKPMAVTLDKKFKIMATKPRLASFINQ